MVLRCGLCTLAQEQGCQTFSKTTHQDVWLNGKRNFDNALRDKGMLTHQDSYVHKESIEFLLNREKIDILSQINHNSGSALAKAQLRNRYHFVQVMRVVLKHALEGLPFHGDGSNEGPVMRTMHFITKYYQPLLQKNMNASKNQPLLMKALHPRNISFILKAFANQHRRHIAKVLKDAKFLALIADEWTDKHSTRQYCSILIRYTTNTLESNVLFIGMFRLHSAKAAAIAKCILDEIQNIVSFHPETQFEAILVKIVAQTYDGASTMQGRNGGVQKLILEHCLYAISIHCFAHQIQLSTALNARSNLLLTDVIAYTKIIVKLIVYSLKCSEHFNEVVKSIKLETHDLITEKKKFTTLKGKILNLCVTRTKTIRAYLHELLCSSETFYRDHSNKRTSSGIE